MQKSCPVIILVRPQIGENIGAAARAMLNFGLKDLRIIAPRDGWPNPKAVSMAKKAVSILDNTRIFDNLADALFDINRLYATSARQRHMVKPEFTPAKAAKDIYTYNNSGNKSAIIFGPENNGLSNEDLNLSDAIITVPVSEDYPSLNLAQAVNIMCYQWLISNNENYVTNQADKLGTPTLADKQQLDNLLEHLAAQLDKTNFFQAQEKRPQMLLNINNIFARANLTEQEVRTMRGIITALSL